MAVFVPRAAGAARRYRDAVRVGNEILHAHAELDGNIELLIDGGAERRLQIAAMDDPVGRAVALRRGLAERDAHDFAAACRAPHAHRRGRHDVRTQPVAETEIEQRARGIG